MPTVRRVRDRLTDRDVDMLVSIFKYRYLSVSQLRRLHFPSLQTATRRLRVLEGEGYVSSFRSPVVSDRIVALGNDGAAVVAERLGVTKDDLAWDGKLKRPKDHLFLQHFLAAAEWRITLTMACQTRSDVDLLGFIPEHVVEPAPRGSVRKYVRDVIADIDRPAEKLTHAPDGVFALRYSGTAALFFLEIDRGTETLSNPTRGVLKTVRFYLNYLLGSGFQRYRTDFGVEEEFKAFRVLMVMPSADRVASVRRICGAHQFNPPKAKRFIWLTDESAVLDDGLLSREWVSIDPKDNERYRILPGVGTA